MATLAGSLALPDAGDEGDSLAGKVAGGAVLSWRPHRGTAEVPSTTGTRRTRHPTLPSPWHLLPDLFPSTIAHASCPSPPVPGCSSSGWYDKAFGAQRGAVGPGTSQRCSQAPDLSHAVAGPKAQPVSFYPRDGDSAVLPGVLPRSQTSVTLQARFPEAAAGPSGALSYF